MIALAHGNQQERGWLGRAADRTKAFLGFDQSGGFLGTNLNPGDFGSAVFEGAFRPGLDYWERAIVDGDNFGGYLVAGIEGAGSGIYSSENPEGVGAMTLGTAQLTLSIGITAKGVGTANPALIVRGIGMFGVGKTNIMGGAVYGPGFQGPLSPGSNVKDWIDWTLGGDE